MKDCGAHDGGTNLSGEKTACTTTVPLRADAQKNRDSILEAATQVFAEYGIDAPLSVVAKRARVGIATLYRRFPERGELINAVFAGKMGEYADLADTALACDNPWEGFRGYVLAICATQKTDHGFMNVLTASFPPEPTSALDAERSRAFRGFNRLVKRAKKSGSLRSDFSDGDLPMLLMAHAGIIEAAGKATPEVSARFLAYMLEGFRTDLSKDGGRRASQLKEPSGSRLHTAKSHCTAQTNRGIMEPGSREET